MLVIAACGEHPSLRVEVTHPPDVVVKTTTIAVYPKSDVLDCEKIEFGDVSDDQLAAAEIDSISITDGVTSGKLDMPRVDPKVIVARGYDESGAYVSAQCADQGVVGEGDVLPIQTVLTATVSVGGIGLDDAEPFQLGVTLTDPLVRSLDGRRVSWRVHGAEDVEPFSASGLVPGADSDWEPEKKPCTNDNGIFKLHLMPPATIGGFATTVRVSWANEPPRTFTALTPVADSKKSLTPVDTAQRWCASRIRNGAHSLVCLEKAAVLQAVDYKVTAQGGGVRFDVNTATLNNPQPIGLLIAQGELFANIFSVDRGSDRDVYAITNKFRVISLFDAHVPGENKLFTGGTTKDVIDVAVLPACGAKPAALLINTKDNGGQEEAFSFPLAEPVGVGKEAATHYGPNAQPNEGIILNRSGCVAEQLPDVAPILHQVSVIDTTGRVGGTQRNTTFAYFDCGSALCSLPMPIPRAGVGFLPSDGQLPERLVSSTFDASGTVLSASVLQADKLGELRLVELERITAAAFPAHLLAGYFDGGPEPDLFWDIVNVNNATTNFQIAYAHEVNGERLSALSGTQQDVLVVDMFVADVNGDNHDDVVVASQDSVLNPAVHELRVIPGQVPIKSFTAITDPECKAKP